MGIAPLGKITRTGNKSVTTTKQFRIERDALEDVEAKIRGTRAVRTKSRLQTKESNS